MKIAQPFRTGMVVRTPRVITRPSRSNSLRCLASRETDLKQLEEFKNNLHNKLESAASAPSPPSPPSSDTRDLEEVKLDDYWKVIEEKTVDGSLLVMDFYTQWCGPCKLIKPTLCDWAEEWEGKVHFRKFEASKENAPVGKQVGVKSVPTFIVYKNNEEVGRVTGKQEAKLRELIEQNM